MRANRGTLPSHGRSDNARSAEQIGERSQQDWRADVSADMDQEDIQSVTRGPLVGRYNVGYDRVARTKDHGQHDHRPEQQAERRDSLRVENTEKPQGYCHHDDNEGQQQIGTLGVLDEEICQERTQGDSNQASGRGQAANTGPGLLHRHATDSLIER